jgi:hypothetical protein
MHTSRVCNLALLPPKSAWSLYPPLLQLAKKNGGVTPTKHDQATAAAMTRHPSYMQAVSALSYVTPSSPLTHSNLSLYDYSLISQMHATFAYFLVRSGLSLVLRIFNQMRLSVKFD